MSNYSIRIEGMSNPKAFIEKWSKAYSDPRENKYTNNIKQGLDTDEAFRQLMLWKNGTDEKFSENKDKAYQGFIKLRLDLNKLKGDSSLSNAEKVHEFENMVKPDKNATIWKIFMLHMINPDEYPIFDQHVYRSFNFFKTGQIKELPIDKYKEIYRIYKEDYSPWFSELKKSNDLEPRMVDQALFSFGRVLKEIGALDKPDVSGLFTIVNE